MAKAIIDAKFLKGQTITTTTKESQNINGELRTVYVPEIREVTVDDVMAVSDKGAEIVFVTIDGQKRTVTK